MFSFTGVDDHAKPMASEKNFPYLDNNFGDDNEALDYTATKEQINID